jgi:hypothetical protein
MPSLFNEYNDDKSPRTSSIMWFSDIVQQYGIGTHKPLGNTALFFFFIISIFFILVLLPFVAVLL